MITIRIFLFIASLPAIYVFNKLIKKKEINFFDLLLLFNTSFFCILPLIQPISAFSYFVSINEEVTIRFFLYYMLFSIPLLIIDYLWTKRCDNKKSLFNITLYIKQLPDISISKYGTIVFIAIAIFSLFSFIPKITSIYAIKDQSVMTLSYEESSFIKQFWTILNFCGSIIMLIYIQHIRHSKTTLLFKICMIAFFINILFLSRRDILCFFLFACLVYYSLHRNMITRKMILLVASVLIFVYYIFFPFYNVIRTADFDTKAGTFQTMIDVFTYGVDNFDNKKIEAFQSSESRSLGLFYALYTLIENDKNVSYGELTISDLDHAIPSVFNPNKGLGSQIELESRTGTFRDIADSVLLLCYGDYRYLGGCFTILFFLLVVSYHILLLRLSRMFSVHIIKYIYVVFILFYMTWQVERALAGLFAGCVTNTIFILLAPLLVTKMFNIRTKTDLNEQNI